MLLHMSSWDGDPFLRMALLKAFFVEIVQLYANWVKVIRQQKGKTGGNGANNVQILNSISIIVA